MTTRWRPAVELPPNLAEVAHSHACTECPRVLACYAPRCREGAPRSCKSGSNVCPPKKG